MKVKLDHYFSDTTHERYLDEIYVASGLNFYPLHVPCTYHHCELTCCTLCVHSACLLQRLIHSFRNPRVFARFQVVRKGVVVQSTPQQRNIVISSLARKALQHWSRRRSRTVQGAGRNEREREREREREKKMHESCGIGCLS